MKLLDNLEDSLAEDPIDRDLRRWKSIQEAGFFKYVFLFGAIKGLAIGVASAGLMAASSSGSFQQIMSRAIWVGPAGMAVVSLCIWGYLRNRFRNGRPPDPPPMNPGGLI